MRNRYPAFLLIVFLTLPGFLFAGEKIKRDLVFAEVDGKQLKLDLYLPENTNKPPLIVFVHGGGWHQGDKNNCKVKWLTQYGYAVASISYRLSDVAIFPAQIHDCKAAVRWLRANAVKYGYSPDKIAAAGSSAGATLALLLGTTGSDKTLEGEIGGHLDVSTRVDAIVDYYGATDFVSTIKIKPQMLEPGSSSYKLLGGPADKKIDLARMASPVSHVSSDDPPLLIFHGGKDPKVPVQHATILEQAYREKKLPVELVLLPETGHGGEDFHTQIHNEKVVSFLRKVWAEKPGSVPPKPTAEKE